ncbi:class I SAM-dependent methyltransferase [Brevundimonas sp. M20]|uniref:class I SAM-dependent methyltransferase n=1 Tax=Brevundimonas sp. M20 TaxID=2591463 RepID=UPI00143DA086|nr:class I SAM-dependent methyltransferase [Brevundimonas sp. M20]
MSTSYNRIAYEALEVCNGVTLATVKDAVARAGLAPGARAADVGTGNATVAIRLARTFGFATTAIEYDPGMAELAAGRIAASGAAVELVIGSAADVLADLPPLDLITALGTTNITGEGRPSPEAGFAFLKTRLTPGGYLLWGDLVWIAEPPAPLRQIAEATNQYTDNTGWKAAAETAGFEVVWSEISPQAVFDAYAAAADSAARHWLATNADAPEAASVQAVADRVKMVLEFGRPFIGFGLYLLKAPA